MATTVRPAAALADPQSLQFVLEIALGFAPRSARMYGERKHRAR
jgi:hypothetical protein